MKNDDHGEVAMFHKFDVMPAYTPRFVTAQGLKELIELYHLARAAGKMTRYDRMIWAAQEYAKANPGISETGAYKDLSAQLTY